MNSRQLLKLGVPADCIREAMSAIESATRAGNLKGKAVRKLVRAGARRIPHRTWWTSTSGPSRGL